MRQNQPVQLLTASSIAHIPAIECHGDPTNDVVARRVGGPHLLRGLDIGAVFEEHDQPSTGKGRQRVTGRASIEEMPQLHPINALVE